MSLRMFFAAALLVCGMSSGASAQHVVTAAEASKLTLDALIATPRPIFRPPIFRPVFRAFYRTSDRAMVRRVMATRRAPRLGSISREMRASRVTMHPHGMTRRRHRR